MEELKLSGGEVFEIDSDQEIRITPAYVDDRIIYIFRSDIPKLRDWLNQKFPKEEPPKPSIVDIAREIATKAHAGQFRRDGVTPYITHPEAVAAMVEGDDAKAVALLHDVMEDCGITECELCHQLPPSIVTCVKNMTKRGDEPHYAYYLERVRYNPLTRAVKIADMKHNLSCDPTPAQVQKYTAGLKFLESECSCHRPTFLDGIPFATVKHLPDCPVHGVKK